MQRSLPEHSPLIASPVVCQTCGDILKPQIIKGRGGVQAIRYSCQNKEHGCSYQTETNVYLVSECVPIRPNGKPA